MDDSGLDMGNEVLVDETICLVCEGSTIMGGKTIRCQTCLRCFHFNCVGVILSGPCAQSDDVPNFCSRCDVQNRNARNVDKTWSQAEDQNARTAALQVEAAHCEVSSFIIPDILRHFQQESLRVDSLGQNVRIADVATCRKSYLEEGDMEVKEIIDDSDGESS